MQTEAFEKALRAFSRGLDFDSERTDLYNLKGYCYFKLGKNEAAIESFQQVIQRNPASAIDYANIASNYRDMGDTESAVAYYKKALAIDPTIDFARENLRRLST
jgi:ribosomal protein S12 methylthiotransferase accessory factor